uniref:CUB domain-containing protein n=1 Tax=Equus asinus asinus TaxID=83772 RepID=A0A8C4M446_EQUAS
LRLVPCGPGALSGQPGTLSSVVGYSGCGGLLTDLSGRISNYIGPKTVCVWTIQMTPGLHVVMAIPGLNLTCHKEYVEIQDGPPGSASYGKICEGLGLTFRSSSNILTVKYTRKPDHPASSFDVYYYGEPEGFEYVLY